MPGSTAPLPRWLCLLRLAQLRYVSYRGALFAFGVLGAGAAIDAYLWLGLVALVVWEALLNLSNHVFDRVEDEIDYPQRTALCQAVGYEVLWRASLALAAAYLALVVAMALVCELPLPATLAWIAFLLGAFSYSTGPRLKVRTVGSLFAAPLPASVALALGWCYRGAVVDILPTAILFLLVRMSASWARDLPNLEGDGAVGFRSLSRRILDPAHPGSRTAALILLPYAVAVAFVLSGARPVRDLSMALLLPLGLVLAGAMVRASTLEERALVRELSNLYQIAVLGVLGIALRPGPASALVCVGALAWYVVATRYLHSDPVPGRRGSSRLLRASARA